MSLDSIFYNINLEKFPRLNEYDTILKLDYNTIKSATFEIEEIKNEDIFIEIHVQPNIMYSTDGTISGFENQHDNTTSNQLFKNDSTSNIIFPILAFNDKYIIDNNYDFTNNDNFLILYIKNGQLILEGTNNNKLQINLDSTEHNINMFNEKFVSNLQRIMIGKQCNTTYMALYLISDEKVLFYTDTTNHIIPEIKEINGNNPIVSIGYLKRELTGDSIYHDYMDGQFQYLNISEKATSYPFVQNQNYVDNRLSKADKYNNYQVQKFNLENSNFANIDINPLYLMTANENESENNILNIQPDTNYIQKIDEQGPTIQDSTNKTFQTFEIIPSISHKKVIKQNLHDINNGYSMLSYDYKNVFCTNAKEMPFNINYISNKSVNGQKDEALCIYNLNILNENINHKEIYFIPIQERGSKYVDIINGTETLVDTTYTCKDFTNIFDTTEQPILVSNLDVDSTYYFNDETSLNITQYTPNIIDENKIHHEMIQKTAYKLKHFILIKDNTANVYTNNNDSSILDLDLFNNNITLHDSTIIDNTVMSDCTNLYKFIQNIILQLEPNFYNNCKLVSGVTENCHIVNLPYNLGEWLLLERKEQLLNQTHKILLNPDTTTKLPPVDFIISKRIQLTKIDYNTSPYVVSTNKFNKNIKLKQKNVIKTENISNIVFTTDMTNINTINYNTINIDNPLYTLPYNEIIEIKPLFTFIDQTTECNPESNLIKQNELIQKVENINATIKCLYFEQNKPDNTNNIFITPFDIPYYMFNKYTYFNNNDKDNNSILLKIIENNNTNFNDIVQLSPVDIFYLTKTKYENIQNLDITVPIKNELIGYQNFDNDFNEINNKFNMWVSNGVTLSEGKFGNAVDFGYGSNEIRINNFNDDSKTYSISFQIFKYNNLQQQNKNFFFSIATSSKGLIVQEVIQNNILRIQKDYEDLNINIFTPIQTWCHFVIIIGKTTKVYYNNNLIYSTILQESPFIDFNNNKTWHFGADNGHYMNGKIDDLFIFNGEIDEECVNFLYNRPYYDSIFSIKNINYFNKLEYIHSPFNNNYHNNDTNRMFYPTFPKHNPVSQDTIEPRFYPINTLKYMNKIYNIYLKYKILFKNGENIFSNKIN